MLCAQGKRILFFNLYFSFLLIFATSLAFSGDMNISGCVVLDISYLGKTVDLNADINGFGASCFALGVNDDDNYFHLDC